MSHRKWSTNILILIWLFTVSLWFFSYVSASTVNWLLTLNIVGLGIRHGTPNNINLWIPLTSSSDQEISGQFDGAFRVEDLLWLMTGHYTTIQCDGVRWLLGNILTWVYLKAGNSDPTLLLWLSGNVRIGTSLLDYTSIISPVTYIYKPTDSANLWLANKYWDIPWLKILIPGDTPAGTYSGTIVFSFYYY